MLSIQNRHRIKSSFYQAEQFEVISIGFILKKKLILFMIVGCSLTFLITFNLSIELIDDHFIFCCLFRSSAKQNSHSSTLTLSQTLQVCLYPISLPALLFGENIIEITKMMLIVMVIVEPDGKLRI